MTEHPPALTERTYYNRSSLAPQKLDRLLRALGQLKSDISGIEARHPGFGSEMSSLCDRVIADLGSLDSTTPPTDHKAHPVSAAIDMAGSHLIAGLDKTGDGIIFILGKLFANRTAKAGPGTSAGPGP